jgi:hypothetical protein
LIRALIKRIASERVDQIDRARNGRLLWHPGRRLKRIR